jgi:release factor glutamine methyltransferase
LPDVDASPDGPVTARLRAAGCVFAEDEALLLTEAASGPRELAALVERRAAGEPLEQVLGWAEFCGLRMVVEPGVFVPRRRTGLLVELATPLVHRTGRPSRSRLPIVVDLCCGCGAVGVALATLVGPVELHAVDIDEAAVRCAQRNLAGVGGHAYHGDLYQVLPRRLAGLVDVLVANAPYVPSGQIPFLPPEARLHEASVALDGGSDGLDVVRRIADGASHWLAAEGAFLVEISRRQAPAVVGLLARAGLAPQVVTSDELNATAVIASGARPDRCAGPVPRGRVREATGARESTAGRRSGDQSPGPG